MNIRKAVSSILFSLFAIVVLSVITPQAVLVSRAAITCTVTFNWVDGNAQDRPAGDITVTIVEAGGTTKTVTLNNSNNWSASTEVGSIETFNTSSYPAGYDVKWGVAQSGQDSCTITVTFTKMFSISVTGGSYVNETDGISGFPVPMGKTVKITANVPEGSRFAGWSGLDGVEFVNITSAASSTAFFEMPARALSVTANLLKEVTVSVSDKTVNFNGTEQTGETEYTFTGISAGHTATITYTPAKGTSAGEYNNGSFGDDFNVTSGGTDVTSNYYLKTRTPGKLIIKPSITTESLPDGKEGETYSSSALEVGGATGSVTWSLSAGSLPPGLTLSTGGVISGTPTTAGTYIFMVQASDSNNYAVTKNLSIKVLQKHNITVSANPTAGGTAQADKASAFKDETVKLTATANAYYEFVKWVCTGNNVVITNEESTTATIEKMPDADVEVTAKFALKQTPAPDPEPPKPAPGPEPSNTDNTDPSPAAEEPAKTTTTSSTTVNPTTGNETVITNTVTKTDTGTIKTQTQVVKDSSGNVVSESKTETVTDEKAGTRTETTMTTDHQAGTVTKEKSVTNIATGAMEGTSVTKTTDGTLKGITTTSVDANGASTHTIYTPLVTETNKIVLAGITDTGTGTVTIPEKIDAADGKTYTVTGIGEKAFKGNTEIKDVSIPGAVTYIGQGAFRGAKGIESFTMTVRKAGNLKVEKNAFRGLKKGTKVTIIAKNRKQFNKIVDMIRKAGGTNLTFISEKA